MTTKTETRPFLSCRYRYLREAWAAYDATGHRNIMVLLGEGYLGGWGCKAAYILNDTDLQCPGMLGSEKILFGRRRFLKPHLATPCAEGPRDSGFQAAEKLDAFFPPIRKREYWTLHLDNNRWPQPDTFQVVDDEEQVVPLMRVLQT
ncbi:hypothetical protein L209DRAFT_742985 [Thermothelomyces heterothallicus CBS 203.75]